MSSLLTWCSILIPSISLIGYMAWKKLFSSSKRKLLTRTTPLEDTEIPKFTISELKNDSKKVSEYLNWMNTEGFTVFTMDDEIEELVNLYWDLTRKFFAKPMEYKTNFKGMPKYKDDIFENKRQVNKGFLTIKEKEFLKLSLSDHTQRIPTDIDGFEECFTKLCTQMEEMATFLYELIGTSIDDSTNKPVHDDEAMKVIKDVLRLGSSVSMIDYQPINKEIAEEIGRADKPTENTHFPSVTHCDTGFLTIIMCSNVPALQIKDRVFDTWFMPEKICDPKKDCFVIIGRKMQQFAEFNNSDTSNFSPTVHRVMLPYNTQRNSLLYFQDIPQ